MTSDGHRPAGLLHSHHGESKPHRTVRFEIAPYTIFLVLGALAGVWLFTRLMPVLLVLVIALFLVGTLNPFVEWVEARHFQRRTAIAIVFGSLFLSALVILGVMLPPLASQANRMILHEPALRDKIVALLSRSRITTPLANSIRLFHGFGEADGAAALEYSWRATQIVGYAISSIFLALYLMIDRDRVRGAFYALIPRRHHIRLSRVIIKLEVIVGGYIRGQVVTSSLMALFTFVLLAIARIEGAVALAVFAGVADVLPYIGVFLSVGPAVLVTLSHGAAWTLIVLGAMLVYEEFESRVLVPRIYGRALRLPSSMVVLALLAGGTIGGILGALLALPVAAALRMLMDELGPDLPGDIDAGESSKRERFARAQTEYELRSEGMSARQAAAIALEISGRVTSYSRS